MLGSFGVAELLIILVIVVVLFGVNKLPKLGKGLGQGIRNFKDSMRPSDDVDSSDEDKGGSAPIKPE
jgi:sec-independent protein translocase protein TatA